MLLAEADALLAPVTAVDGFVLACLVDASTGMILAQRQESAEVSLPTAAAGAVDIANAISLLSARLGTDDDLEDVMLAFGRHLHVIRLLPVAAEELPVADREPQLLFLVVLDRQRTNLAMARREIRDFCESFAP